jgi:DNA-binding transcriptional LysR family regulator
VGRELEAGALVPVLPLCSLVDEGAIHIVTPSGSAGASKTRAFSDWIAARLADPPWVPRAKVKAGRTAARG